jgi:hypothetical protein
LASRILGVALWREVDESFILKEVIATAGMFGLELGGIYGW